MINIRGGYGLVDPDGERLIYTDSNFPADETLSEWMPEIITTTLGDLMSAALLAMFDVDQVVNVMKTWGRSYQQGQQAVCAQSTGVTIASGKRFIKKVVYNPIKTTVAVTVEDYLQLPRRGKLTPQQNQQYIDGLAKQINNPTGDGITPRSVTFSEQAAPSAPAEDTGVLYIDTNGDLVTKINHGGVTKTVIIVDWSTS